MNRKLDILLDPVTYMRFVEPEEPTVKSQKIGGILATVMYRK